MTALVIVQARLGSARLPGKTLMDIGGHTALWHVMERVKMAGLPYILTIPAQEDADPDHTLRRYVELNGWPVSEGPHPDMARAFRVAYFVAGQDLGDRISIVRVTADCPFVQVGDIQRYAAAIMDQQMDANGYASNAHPVRNVPKGLDVEVFTPWALDNACGNGTIEQRHHVTPWMRWSLGLATSTDDGEFRVTLDTAEDLARLRHIAATIDCTPPHPTLQELRDYFRSNADIPRAT